MEVEFVGAIGVLGMVVLGIGILARTGRLTRNGVVGLRTPTLMASDEAWQVGHRVASRWLVTLGGASLLVVVLTIVAGGLGVLPSWAGSQVALDVVLVVQVLAVCWIAIYAGRVVRKTSSNKR